MPTNPWPFGIDADRDDPLTALRIAVTGSHPEWCYLVGFDRESPVRPTDAEADMLASYLDEYKTYWYGKEGGYRTKLAERLLDVDGGANGVIFHKYADNDWGIRRRTWESPSGYTPRPPFARETYPREGELGRMTLDEVMDWDHDTWPQRWLKWKATHADTFRPACKKCPGEALNILLGHTPLAHKTANSLTVKDVRTLDDLIGKGLEWVLDFTGVGAKGVELVEKRLMPDDRKQFTGTRWSVQTRSTR